MMDSGIPTLLSCATGMSTYNSARLQTWVTCSVMMDNFVSIRKFCHVLGENALFPTQYFVLEKILQSSHST